MHGPQPLNLSLGLDEFVALVAVAAASWARFCERPNPSLKLTRYGSVALRFFGHVNSPSPRSFPGR
jgi:hypothetical protein